VTLVDPPLAMAPSHLQVEAYRCCRHFQIGKTSLFSHYFVTMMKTVLTLACVASAAAFAPSSKPAFT